MNNRIVSWFSCGAASAVATKLAIRKYKDVVVAYTEVAEEHVDNKRFLSDCEEWFGQKILIMRNETYEGSIYKVFEKNYMRTPHGSPCTRALKKQLREKFEEPDDVQIFGYTKEEQGRVNRFLESNPYVNLETPLIDNKLGKSDCLAIIEEVGIELPTMYKLGYNNNNCIGCVKGGMGYWNKIRVDFPDQFKRMADLEKTKGCTVLRDKNGPLYLHDLDPYRGNYPKEPSISCGIFCEMIDWSDEDHDEAWEIYEEDQQKKLNSNAK